jgi:hypothetical protein
MLLCMVALAACGGDDGEAAPDAPAVDVCANDDGGFTVAGCSNTFEATVAWVLLARDGSELASGNTQGGTLDQPGPFTFSVEYTLDARQVGHLEVFEPPVTEEGFPPPKEIVPLVLEP